MLRDFFPPGVHPLLEFRTMCITSPFAAPQTFSTHCQCDIVVVSASPPEGQGVKRMAAVDSNMPAKQQRAVIVGGGPAGALLALYLDRRRFEVQLFEAMDEDKIARRTQRSWNVVLMGRGREAIDNAGVDLHEEV